MICESSLSRVSGKWENRMENNKVSLANRRREVSFDKIQGNEESIPFLVEIKERLPLSFALIPVKRFSGPLMCRSLVAR